MCVDKVAIKLKFLTSGHRRALSMKKGNSIYQFLQKALEDLRPDFTELR
jgi:protein FAM50